jgi:hypothetical protein
MMPVTDADREAMKALQIDLLLAGAQGDPDAWRKCEEAFAAHRELGRKEARQVDVSALYGYEAGLEEGKRMAAKAEERGRIAGAKAMQKYLADQREQLGLEMRETENTLTPDGQIVCTTDSDRAFFEAAEVRAIDPIQIAKDITNES